MLRSIRGAISVSQNDAQEIKKAVSALVEPLLSRNQIHTPDIVAVFFTMTSDLTAANPATALRQIYADWQHVSLLCSQEPVVDGMLPQCIRILIQWHTEDTSQPLVPIYLDAAKQLRPDL